MKTPAVNTTVSPGTNWVWGTDLENCLRAARDTKDPAKLEKMAEDILTGRVSDDGEITEALILNSYAPFAAVLKLARLWGNMFSVELCQRPDATAEALKEFSKYFNAIDAEIIVTHPNTDPKTRLKVARLLHPWDLASLIEERRIKDSELKHFANHEDNSVRACVASVTSSPALLNALAEDEEPDVCDAALMNENIAIEVLEKKVMETDYLPVQAAAARRSTNPEILSRLLGNLEKHYDAGLADALKQNEHTPKHLRVVAALKRPDGN